MKLLKKPLNDTTITTLTRWLEQEDDFVFLESGKVSEGEHKSLLFRNPHSYLICRPGDDAADFLARADRLRRDGYHLAGWFAYEFGYLMEPCLYPLSVQPEREQQPPLAVLGVFDAPLIYNHLNGVFTNGSGWPEATSESVFEETSFSCTDLTPTLSQSRYLEAVHKIKEYITAGDTYQVNFTLHLDFLFHGSVAALYRALRRNQSVSYGAWIRHQGREILSFSPELFFSSDQDRVRVRPMKGTMARGRTSEEDAMHRQHLRTDPKNRSENVMIVDLLRNDLGRLLHGCGGGRVVPRSLFDVETYQSLLQMTSTVDGIPTDMEQLSLQSLFASLFPCGSVTGAPKVHTMEIIHELELQSRGVYCGAIGYSSRETSCFNVPIRTLELQGGRGRMGIGSGIVADSEPQAEWEECLLKGNFLTRNEPDFQLIETLLYHPEDGFFLLEYHLDRLQDSAVYFQFACATDEIRQQLKDAVSVCGDLYRVRLLLHRDGRVDISKTVMDAVVMEPLPEELPHVIFSNIPVDEQDPYIFHKTTRRELFDRERKRGATDGWYEVLFCNSRGEVTEGTIFNLFVVIDGTLVTPPLRCGLLAGTCRRMLLEQGRVVERVVRQEEVLEADAVYVGNSVRGLVQVCVTVPGRGK